MRLIHGRQVDAHPLRVEMMIRLAVQRHRRDFYLARRQRDRLHLETGTADRSRRIEIEHHRPLLHQQIGVQVREIIELKNVIAALRMASLVSAVANQIRRTVGLDVKKDLAVIVIKKRQIKKSRTGES